MLLALATGAGERQRRKTSRWRGHQHDRPRLAFGQYHAKDELFPLRQRSPRGRRTPIRCSSSIRATRYRGVAAVANSVQGARGFMWRRGAGEPDRSHVSSTAFPPSTSRPVGRLQPPVSCTSPSAATARLQAVLDITLTRKSSGWGCSPTTMLWAFDPSADASTRPKTTHQSRAVEEFP